MWPCPAHFTRQPELAGETTGTTWSAAFYADPSLPDSLFLQCIRTALDNLVVQMSHWREDSALSRFNRLPDGQWAAVPPEFFQVLEAALEIARRSGGAFDPSLGRGQSISGALVLRAPRRATFTRRIIAFAAP
jgi:FAD:protein FMN transferase